MGKLSIEVETCLILNFQFLGKTCVFNYLSREEINFVNMSLLTGS